MKSHSVRRKKHTQPAAERLPTHPRAHAHAHTLALQKFLVRKMHFRYIYLSMQLLFFYVCEALTTQAHSLHKICTYTIETPLTEAAAHFWKLH